MYVCIITIYTIKQVYIYRHTTYIYALFIYKYIIYIINK